MRITENAFVSDFLRNITRSRARINRLNNQLSAQRKVLTVSDDPDASNLIMRLDGSLARIAQYKKNIDDAKSTLSATSVALKSATDVTKGIKEIITGSTNVRDPEVLKQFGAQVDQLLDHALEIANTNFNRKYIFGGSNSTTPPFTWSGVPPRIVYNGNADALKIQVGEGLSQVVNVSGQEAFPDGNGTLDVALGSALNANAAVGSSVTSTVTLTDTGGVTHDVVFTFTKTAANRWTMASAPATGANATVTGGSGELVFDPSSGGLLASSSVLPLTVTPTGGAPAPKLIVGINSSALTESATGGAVTATPRNGSTLIFNRIAELRDKLMSGQTPDVNDLAIFQDFTDHLMRQEAQAGFLQTNLENASSYLALQETQMQNQRSAVQDIDLAEIGVALNYEQTMLDAALSTGAKIIPKSLLDFLT
jgi:flagellar hook-associated protein 3 FlgL